MEHKTTLILTALLTLALGIVLGAQIAPNKVEVKEVQVESVHECPAPSAQRPVGPEIVCEGDQSKEYYEQAVALFIAAIGIKLTQKQSLELESLSKNPRDYYPSQDLDQAILKDTVVDTPHSDIPGPNKALFFKNYHISKELKKEGAELSDFRDRELLNKSLHKVLKEPNIFYARSKDSEDIKLLKKFNGSFRGFVYHLRGEHKGTTDTISFYADFRVKSDKKIDGEFQLLLSRDGVTYNDSRGTGGNGNIRTLGDEIIIKAGPERYFHFVDRSLTMANFYSAGQFVGVARLTRD